MFRTIVSPSSGATFNKLYSAIGTFVPVRLVAANHTGSVTVIAIVQYTKHFTGNGMFLHPKD